jgi:hypothetical protein
MIRAREGCERRSAYTFSSGIAMAACLLNRSID